jgi:hypothetical protein
LHIAPLVFFASLHQGSLDFCQSKNNLSKEIILGALISAKKEINKEPAAKSLFKSIGQGAFMGFGEDKDDNRDATN